MRRSDRPGRPVRRSPRPLSAREREILTFLLSVEAPGVTELRQQAETARATPWDCGCASIDITVDRTTTPASSLRIRPAIESESKERHDTGRTFDLLVWVDEEGYLDGLEIVDYIERHGDDSPDEIPPPAEFEAPRVRSNPSGV